MIYPAASRNKEPILKVLQRFIENKEQNGDVTFLEISSGSGQHIAHFAPQFTHVKFQPSEFDESLLGSITYYANECKSHNVLQPVLIDIQKNLSTFGFSENSIDYIYNANMIHISPYECTIGLFENAGKYLKPDGLLFTYGPYGKNGIVTPESNVRFNETLISRDPSWGIRDLCDLEKLAGINNLKLIEEVDMPANNKTLIWQKNKDQS